MMSASEISSSSKVSGPLDESQAAPDDQIHPPQHRSVAETTRTLVSSPSSSSPSSSSTIPGTSKARAPSSSSSSAASPATLLPLQPSSSANLTPGGRIKPPPRGPSTTITAATAAAAPFSAQRSLSMASTLSNATTSSSSSSQRTVSANPGPRPAQLQRYPSSSSSSQGQGLGHGRSYSRRSIAHNPHVLGIGGDEGDGGEDEIRGPSSMVWTSGEAAEADDLEVIDLEAPRGISSGGLTSPWRPPGMKRKGSAGSAGSANGTSMFGGWKKGQNGSAGGGSGIKGKGKASERIAMQRLESGKGSAMLGSVQEGDDTYAIGSDDEGEDAGEDVQGVKKAKEGETVEETFGVVDIVSPPTSPRDGEPKTASDVPAPYGLDSVQDSSSTYHYPREEDSELLNTTHLDEHDYDDEEALFPSSSASNTGPSSGLSPHINARSRRIHFEPLTKIEQISAWATTACVLVLALVAVAIGVNWIDWPGDGIGNN